MSNSNHLKGNKMNTQKFLEQRRKRQQEQASRQDAHKSNIPWLKLPQGKHQVRFLPKGNIQENLPYKSCQVHSFKLRSDGGQTLFLYALCYRWLFTHEDAKENTIQPLREMGKLTDEDIKAYKKLDCPACRAREVLYKGGEDKEIFQQFNVRNTNYWNVLLRSDSKVYVWSVGQGNHDDLSSEIETYLDIDEETGQPGENAVDILHPKKGYDHIIDATGEKNNRRYKIRIKPGKTCPIGELADGEAPLDLIIVVADTLRPYGELCQLVRRQQGKLLASYGFEFGISMPEEKKKNVMDDDEEDEEDSNDLKAKKASVKTNPSSIPWDDDEENPKPLKKKAPVVVEEDDDDEDDVEDIEDDDEEEETELVKGHLVNKKTGKKIF
jgi:hypothetical protein